MTKTMRAVVAAAALASSLVLSSCCALGMLMHAAGMGSHGEHARHESAQAAGSAKPAAIGDEVACAVDGMKMRRTADTPVTEYRGRVYYFCNDAEQRVFLKQPERYAAK